MNNLLTVFVGSSINPKSVVVSDKTTIAELFRNNNITVPTNAIITCGSKRITDPKATLASLKITSGAAILYSEKLNSASK